MTQTCSNIVSYRAWEVDTFEERCVLTATVEIVGNRRSVIAVGVIIGVVHSAQQEENEATRVLIRRPDSTSCVNGAHKIYDCSHFCCVSTVHTWIAQYGVEARYKKSFMIVAEDLAETFRPTFLVISERDQSTQLREDVGEFPNKVGSPDTPKVSVPWSPFIHEWLYMWSFAGARTAASEPWLVITLSHTKSITSVPGSFPWRELVRF